MDGNQTAAQVKVELATGGRARRPCEPDGCGASKPEPGNGGPAAAWMPLSACLQDSAWPSRHRLSWYPSNSGRPAQTIHWAGGRAASRQPDGESHTETPPPLCDGAAKQRRHKRQADAESGGRATSDGDSGESATVASGRGRGFPAWPRASFEGRQAGWKRPA
ncbi:uncharacterized protein PSFLO_01335 [Pseudozyma flocculosa]|uniref:Uncharacterized protein n=1 Tax=Pseudozyma flocculosa TaxID=84751 RepID=A0A5C3EU31_9BASI|nr:uncharacterized protein PSFLO_01335 [Pseudozyma flocculosa]